MSGQQRWQGAGLAAPPVRAEPGTQPETRAGATPRCANRPADPAGGKEEGQLIIAFYSISEKYTNKEHTAVHPPHRNDNR